MLMLSTTIALSQGFPAVDGWDADDLLVQASRPIPISGGGGGTVYTPYPIFDVPTMTANTAPFPNIVSADSEYSASYQAWAGFDKRSSGEPYYWATLNVPFPHYITYTTAYGFTNIVATFGTRSYFNYGIKLFTFAGSQDNTNWTILISNTLVDPAAWHHLVFEYNYGTTPVDTENGVYCFVDGVYFSHNTGSHAPVIENLPLYIGEYYGGGPYYWQGKITLLRFYNRAITTNEITTIHTRELNGLQ